MSSSLPVLSGQELVPPIQNPKLRIKNDCTLRSLIRYSGLTPEEFQSLRYPAPPSRPFPLSDFQFSRACGIPQLRDLNPYPPFASLASFA